MATINIQDLINGSIPTGPSTPAPTYSITPSTVSVNEGGTVVYTISTTNVAGGTVLYWTNSGNTVSSDFVGNSNSGSEPYDRAALSAYYLDLNKQAAEYGEKALELSPDDARLQKNLEFYQEKAH